MASEGNQKSNARFESFGRKLDKEFGDAARKLEQESEKVIAYLNDEVVPAIRNHSTKALRTAADKLSKLAEYMEHNTSK
jgi:hypothetical protein